jgi:hypothetical protein
LLRFALIAGLAGVISTAAMAQPSAQSPGSAPEPTTNATSTADASANDPDKVICRNVKPPTGTRLGSARNRQRVCQTKEQWDEQARAAQEALKVRDSGICAPGECSG